MKALGAAWPDRQAAMAASDHVIIPIRPDLYSLRGLRNLGPVLDQWRTDRSGIKPDDSRSGDISIAVKPDMELSADDTRGLVVAAALGECRPDADAVLRSLGLLQLDPLSRVAKAHRLTCLARLAASASADEVDARLWSDGYATAFETWVHAACLVPVEDWPLLRIARDRIKGWAGGPPQTLLAEVRRLVASSPDGVTITEVEDPGRRTSGWEWSDRKRAVEYMLRSGDLVCTARRGSKRVYDLPERRIPGPLLADGERSGEDLLAAVALRAVRAMAVATTGDVARYYNISADQALTGLRGAGVPQASVEGWEAPGWIDPAITGPPEAACGPVLIGPFDNLIWDRQRTRRVFGFDYMFEAYKPEPKRIYGYYVMALLDNGRLTGRADLRRQSDLLHILAAHPEPGTDPDSFETALNSATARLQHQLTPHPGQLGLHAHLDAEDHHAAAAASR